MILQYFIILSFLYSELIMSKNVYNPYLHYGNELQQFERYEFITKSIKEHDFFDQIDQCEDSIIPEKGHRSYQCRYDLREQRQKLRKQHHWNRLTDNRKKHTFQVDCEYRIDTFENIKFKFKYLKGYILNQFVVFNINQHTCKSLSTRSFSSSSSIAIAPAATGVVTTTGVVLEEEEEGGSNFEIFIHSSSHLASCNTIDLFNNTYQVYCPLPDISSRVSQKNKKHLSLLLCSNISISLHYEHYDAFCDIGHSQFASLHHNIYKGPICIEQTIATNQSIYLANTTNSSTSINATINSDIHRISNSVNNRNFIQVTMNHSSLLRLHTANDFHTSLPIWTKRPLSKMTATHIAILGNHPIYEWRGQEYKYLTISAMRKCLYRQTLWFIGESHMRYQFDITMDRYVDKLNIGRYHGSMNVSGVSYSDNTFSHRLIDFIDSLPCPKREKDIPSQQVQTLVIQTGSWDLQFFPPRGYIRNPSQGPGVMEAIHRLKERPFCSKVYKIIWMSIMPHPYCTASHEHCLRLMNYWRNNAAIRAANQFIEKQLIELDYPDLLLLDTPSVALARFPLHEIVCVDHFLCNDQPRGFVTTPTGIALGNEVLTAACRIEMQESKATFADGGLVKIYNTSIIHNHKQISTFQYYSIEGGCRREIPNEYTLRSMGASDTDFTLVSVTYILDIPICFRERFLDRNNGIMYQTYSDKTVFYMDLGYRRAMNSIQTLIQLGRDLDEVKFVLEKDLESIPLGKLLIGKSDCNWCKK